MSKYAVVSQEDLELIRRATAECAAILIPPDTENDRERLRGMEGYYGITTQIKMPLRGRLCRTFCNVHLKCS